MAVAQGCSDAGICYFSAHKSDIVEEKVIKNSIDFGYVFGKGPKSVTYNNAYLGYNHDFSEQFNLSLRTTYNQAHGDFGTIGQLGDVFLVGNYNFLKTEKSSWESSFGTKIPLTSANSKINGFALPMEYQPSLGTYDALFGITYHYAYWDFNSSLQLPVIQSNRNSYFDEFSASNDYPSTNLFKRRSDLLLRGSYNFITANQKWSFKPNLIGIYHLGNDSFEDVFGQRKTIADSKGFTVNANLISEYSITNQNSIQWSLAIPLVVRKVKPDGLTRALITQVSYQYKF